MSVYRSKYGQYKVTSHAEAMRYARQHYHDAQKKSPRRLTYIRSKYFKSEKVFLDQFWKHLDQKERSDQLRRLKLYRCALDLISNTTLDPDSIVGYAQQRTIVHKFWGITSNGEAFAVQIKENKRTKRKDFMSVFPAKQPYK